MIVSKIIGGLGNQMFQYAAGRALSLRLGAKYFIDTTEFAKYKVHKFGLNCFHAPFQDTAPINYFHLDKNPIKNIVQKIFNGSALDYMHEKSFEYDNNILSLKDNTFLDGYWQSEKYFHDYSDVIRSDFTIKYPMNSNIRDWFEEIRNTRSISLHVRRGDYISNQSANNLHGTCTLDYYAAASDYIKQRVGSSSVFYVFSDDPDWVQSNLKLDANCRIVSHGNKNSDYDELRLMSICEHNIIANSTFSWWGGWLNHSSEKIVIAPKRWFKNKSLNTKDLIPSSWITL